MEEHHPFFDPQAEARSQLRRQLALSLAAILCALGLVGWLVIR
jgi:hypothetical protein